jgi:hypothetical protein
VRVADHPFDVVADTWSNQFLGFPKGQAAWSQDEPEKAVCRPNIFTELKMPRERDEVRAELEKTTAADEAI